MTWGDAMKAKSDMLNRFNLTMSHLFLLQLLKLCVFKNVASCLAFSKKRDTILAFSCYLFLQNNRYQHIVLLHQVSLPLPLFALLHHFNAPSQISIFISTQSLSPFTKPV